MIIKDKGRKDIGFLHLASYIWLGAVEESEEEVPSFLIRHNVEGFTPKAVTEEFQERYQQRRYRGKNGNSMHHLVLSWHPDDNPNLSNDAAEDMAYTFLERYAPDALGYGTIHRNKEHVHLHLMVSNTNADHRSIRLTKAEFAEVKRETWAYQRQHYPEIQHSYDEKEAKKRGFNQEQKRNGRGLYAMAERDYGSIQALRKQVVPILEQAKTIGSFISQIRALGLEEYLTPKRKQLKGFEYEGKKYGYHKLFLDTEQRKKFTKFFRPKYQDWVQHRQDLEHTLRERELEERLVGREYGRS